MTLAVSETAAHLDVLTPLVADGPVIPMRFGTLAPDDDAVREEVLRPSQQLFENSLREQADVVEILLTVYFDEDAALSAVWTAEGAGAAEGDPVADRIALGEQIAGRLSAHARDWGEQLFAPVTHRAQAVVTLDPPEYTALRCAFLVDRQDVRAVDAEMKRIPLAVADGAVPCEIDYIGPLPPLDFPIETTTEDSASSRWGW